MAQRIGDEPIGFVRNVDFSLDVPTLLTMLSVSEEHLKHIQAIQVLGTFLDKIARKSIEINDPELIDIMFQMKLVDLERKNNEDI